MQSYPTPPRNRAILYALVCSTLSLPAAAGREEGRSCPSTRLNSTDIYRTEGTWAVETHSHQRKKNFDFFLSFSLLARRNTFKHNCAAQPNPIKMRVSSSEKVQMRSNQTAHASSGLCNFSLNCALKEKPQNTRKQHEAELSPNKQYTPPKEKIAEHSTQWGWQAVRQALQKEKIA